MLAVDALILIAAVLLLFAIASSKFSARMGLPVLIVFIGLGMAAGSEGVGGIAFESFALANGIGTVALALILFDGGLRTSTGALRAAWRPALTLATVGVLITAVTTGFAASWILGIPMLEGILLGSIVGSTDAAAVFAVLRGQGTQLPQRLGSTLEVESGSNDPMAVFLTLGVLEVLLGRVDPGLPLVGLFVVQMGLGAAIGLLVGYVGIQANRLINLDAAGLYPVMMAAVGFLAYGAAASLGGSGFLSVYLAGIVLGNGDIVFRRGILLFSDGMAWLAQIVMFTMLGLLSFPSRLLAVAGAGLAISAVLILVARPLAVATLLAPFGFGLREMALVSWGGLRGAVPIILATFPLLLGLPDGAVLFDIVFFVVLVSALTQGWTLPLVARRLRLQEPVQPVPAVTLEIASLRDVKGDIVEYAAPADSRAAGRLVRELALPDGAVVAMITRGQEIIPPRGSTRVAVGDHVFLVVRPDVRPLVDRVFSRGRAGPEPPPVAEFPLAGRTRVADIREFYGIEIDAAQDATLERVVREGLAPDPPEVGRWIQVGAVRLCVRELGDEGIEQVGLQLFS